eukprot:scaffold306693_cov31-Attheya_sp.AAC.1
MPMSQPVPCPSSETVASTRMKLVVNRFCPPPLPVTNSRAINLLSRSNAMRHIPVFINSRALMLAAAPIIIPTEISVHAIAKVGFGKAAAKVNKKLARVKKTIAKVAMIDKPFKNTRYVARKREAEAKLAIRRSKRIMVKEEATKN